MSTGQTQQGGTGDAHTTAVANTQTKILIGILAPFLIALMGAATAWLQSVGTAHEVTLKEELVKAVKEVLAGQQKATEIIKQDVKPAALPAQAPVVVAPPIAAPQPGSSATAGKGPLDGLSPEVANQAIADYLKAREDKLKK